MLQFDLTYGRGAGVLTGYPDLLPQKEEEFGQKVVQLNIPRPKKHQKTAE